MNEGNASLEYHKMERFPANVRDIHMVIPRSWLTSDCKSLRSPIDGAAIQRIDELKKRPGRYSVRLHFSSDHRAEEVFLYYRTDSYRSRGIFCEPFFTNPSQREAFRSYSSSRSTKRHIQSRTPTSTRPKRVSLKKSPTRYRPNAIEYIFGPKLPDFAPESVRLLVPCGRRVSLFLLDNTSVTRSPPPSPSPSPSPLRRSYHTHSTPLYEIACYSDSEEDIHLLG